MIQEDRTESDTETRTGSGSTTMVADRVRFDWDVFGLTHPGKVRQVNEDALCMHRNGPLWVVADGMGGHSAGDLASSDIAEAFRLLELPRRLSTFADQAESTLLDLNAKFRRMADYGKSGITIGSTVVALMVRDGYGLFLWVGDSRLYRSRRGRLRQLSQDHSQVEELINQGVLRREDAETHKAANVITRAVGATDDLYCDFDYTEVVADDRFLLCSDGLSKELPEQRIAEILATEQSAESSGRALLAETLQGRARDNFTLIVATAGTEYRAP